jgi:hypothetical protein
LKILALPGPTGELGVALTRFESQFTYPLGPGRSFRISHGGDYTRFYRSIGEAVCFVAENEGEVLGTICGAVRPLLQPDGRQRLALYLGDLKVASRLPGRALLKLAEAMRDWASPKVDAAYSVVMDGTRVTPERYTGRLGIPSFQKLAQIAVLRFEIPPADELSADSTRDWRANAEAGEACYVRLAAGCFASRGGNPELRSDSVPRWLMDFGGGACGRLEDTRRAKRLWADDGREMKSAHLSCFAYRDAAAGIRLITSALDFAARLGFPALFLAVPVSDIEAFSTIPNRKPVIAPATIYGTGLELGQYWMMNTAEI